jgi:hypothetical protein
MCALQFHIPEVTDSMSWNRTVPHHGTVQFHDAEDRSGRTHVKYITVVRFMYPAKIFIFE